MVASASSCTCDQCGVVCTGRFSSCRDVWARGPQPFTVVSPPAMPTPVAPGSGSAAGAANNGHGDRSVAGQHAALQSQPLPPAAGYSSGLEQVADIESRLGALEAVAAYVQALRRALRKELERVGAEAKDRDRLLAEATERVATLETRIATLQTIPARVDSLSRDVFEARRSGTTEFEERIGRLEATAESFGPLRARVTAIEAVGRRVADMESLERRLAALESASTGKPEPVSEAGPSASE